MYTGYEVQLREKYDLGYQSNSSVRDADKSALPVPVDIRFTTVSTRCVVAMTTVIRYCSAAGVETTWEQNVKLGNPWALERCPALC